MLDDKLANRIIILVTVVWAINFAAGLVPAFNYKPDPTIHAIFTAIVGGAFALKRGKTNGNGNGKKEKSPKEDVERQ